MSLVKNLKSGIYFFIIFIIVNFLISIVNKYIQIYLNTKPYYSWWSNNEDKLSMSDIININKIISFNFSKYVYNIKSYLNKESDDYTETDIMFLQSIILNNIVMYDNDYPFVDKFIKPYHLFKSISWLNNDYDIFNQGVYKNYSGSAWYNYVKDTTSSIISPEGTGWYICSKYGPTSIIINTDPSNGPIVNGFWPSQNGCISFFDIPPTFKKDLNPSIDPETDSNLQPYNLTDNIPAISQEGSGKYIPGYPGAKGSWAQLFADWGIAYTIYKDGGVSEIPVISSGYIYDQAGGTIITPVSNLQQWENSSITELVGNGQYIPGLNFFAANKIVPDSYLITSWVAQVYNDKSVKRMVFDAQGIGNLLGLGGFGDISGGWLRFLKGINTRIHSYDDIMNQLFRKYSTNFTPILQLPNGSNCKGLNAAGTALGYFNAAAGTGAALGLKGAPIAVPVALLFHYIETSGDKNNCK